MEEGKPYRLFSIERPVIIKVFDLDLTFYRGEFFFELPLSIFFKKTNGIILEIFLKPFENGAYIKDGTFQSVFLLIVNECYGTGI